MMGSLDTPHALCLTASANLRRTLRRTQQAAGCTVEFRAGVHAEEGASLLAPHLVVVDDEVRRANDFAQLQQIGAAEGGLIFLGSSLEDDEILGLLRDHLDHVISDADAPDETELVVTSVKLLSGDIFGLEKYLSWGVKVYQAEVRSYEDKRVALVTVAEHAKQVGARRQLIAKIESVCDELLMNAMYDAPAARKGEPARVPDRPDEVPHDGRPCRLRYACDGRYFAVSVEDCYGELRKPEIFDHLRRARSQRGRPRNDAAGGGAGLGLYFVLASVTRFVANIQRGSRTEVVCMFDLRQSGRETDSCARSLHVFSAAPDPLAAVPPAGERLGDEDTHPG
jgi:anti-sigma regulatory factor (Ser/Thr protein kinase)